MYNPKNIQKNVRNPNHHYFSKKYRNTPPICIAIRLQFGAAVLLVPLRSEEREILSARLPFILSVCLPFILSVRLPFVSQYFWENLGYTQSDYRTELYYFRILFGNSCSVIIEPNCFWIYLVSVRSVSRGLPNPLPNYIP